MRHQRSIAKTPKGSGRNRRDLIRERVLELCSIAEASIAAIRKLDLEAPDVAAFSDAYAGVAHAGYYFQGLEHALEARIRVNEAAQAIRFLRIEDGEDGLTQGLTERLLIEARQKIGWMESAAPALTLVPFTPRPCRELDNSAG
jgi:hypothetical protein